MTNTEDAGPCRYNEIVENSQFSIRYREATKQILYFDSKKLRNDWKRMTYSSIFSLNYLLVRSGSKDQPKLTTHYFASHMPNKQHQTAWPDSTESAAPSSDITTRDALIPQATSLTNKYRSVLGPPPPKYPVCIRTHSPFPRDDALHVNNVSRLGRRDALAGHDGFRRRRRRRRSLCREHRGRFCILFACPRTGVARVIGAVPSGGSYFVFFFFWASGCWVELARVRFADGALCLTDRVGNAESLW